MKRIVTIFVSILLMVAAAFGMNSYVSALGPNLVPNPSVESGTVGSPSSWASGKWGTNTTTFSHKVGGHTGSYALNIKMTAHTSGDAKWYFTPVNVTPNTSYTVSNWYQSTTPTTVAAVVTSTTGAVSYISLGTPAASATWKQNSYTYVTPANAAKMTIYHFIESVGELTVDDYSVATTDTTPPPPPPPVTTNLIANPSLETSANGTSPNYWYYSKWGTNTTSFKYATIGHTGSRSAEITTTAFSNGGSHWMYDSIAVTPGKVYEFSHWYKSSVMTPMYIRLTMQDGSVKETWLGDAQASSSWTPYSTRITAPANASRIAVFQSLRTVGTLATDDYSFREVTPVPYSRAIVSVSFDDGWANQYTAARPVLNGLGFKSTFYAISGTLNTTYYMTGAQAKSLHTDGHEIASHSVTHSNFTNLSATQMTNEFANSQIALQNLLGAPVTSFAYPYGAYTTANLNTGKTYYNNQRSIDPGYNYRDAIDATKLKAIVVTNAMTTAEVQNLIDNAIAQKSWLILTYHEIATSPVIPSNTAGMVTPANFNLHMNYLKNKGVSVQTVKSALAEVQAQ
ncbi:polysaccharide deacetylase family protein [Candidatus Saccharibacteria bacterium]|nr:MAG: polysaccharide deacetylase family protein [Candidatus Saccharibacteria bacterium]